MHRAYSILQTFLCVLRILMPFILQPLVWWIQLYVGWGAWCHRWHCRAVYAKLLWKHPLTATRRYHNEYRSQFVSLYAYICTGSYCPVSVTLKHVYLAAFSPAFVRLLTVKAPTSTFVILWCPARMHLPLLVSFMMVLCTYFTLDSLLQFMKVQVASN